ncbi:MAG TPA: hypothetical protein VGR92_15520 [Steroidobacteraceae bacterium]|nr:hypothetical protein [Steroidobacteraceae bacterium]
MRAIRLLPVLFFICTIFPNPAPAGDPVVNDTWKGGTGNWSAAANWSAGVPNNGTPSGTTYNVFIDGGNAVSSAVTLDISAGINSLTVDTDDALTLDNNTSLTVSGPTVTNNGAIHMNGGASANGFLTLGGNVTLSGTGTLTMTDLTGGGDAFLQGNGTTLTNQSTIQGTGIIGNGSLAIVNSGTIAADSSSGKGALTLNGSGGIANTGVLEATGGGALTINTTVIGTGGNITASGAGSSVNLNNSTIRGGTLNSSAGGVLQTAVGTTAVLDGGTDGAVTISAGSTYTANDNSSTNLLGTVTDKGVLQLNGGASANGFLNISSGTVTLNGGGVVTMSDASGGGDAFLQGNGNTLTNEDTIQGTGIIGNGSLILVNSATIDALSGGKGALTLNGSGGVTNTGVLEATSGGALTINTTVNNASGNITAGAASSVNLSNATIQGGTLNNSAGGTLQTVVGTTAALDGSTAAGAVTLSAGSTYTASNSSTTNLLGTLTDKGALKLNGGANANGFVNLSSSTVTLNGGGVLTMSDATGGGDAVIQGNNNKLANLDTIQGTGIIGNGSLAIVNSGTIDADTSTGKGALTLNGSGGITNTGLLEATGGGALTINTTVSGGNITASGTGSSVNFNNATIQGATLNDSAGGVLQTVPGTTAVLDGSTAAGAVTLSTGSTYTATNNSTTNLLGTLTDKGVLQLDGGANANGFLNISSSKVTLNGGGVVMMSDAAGGGDAVLQGNSNTLINQDTIAGSGIIGNGSLAVANSATIDATAGGKAALTLNGSGGITNTGLLEATGGGALTINTTVSGGNITASGAGSSVNFNNATIRGATLNDSAGGVLQTVPGTTAVLDGSTDGAITISTGSTYTANNNSTTNLLGTVTDKGVLQLNGGANANGFLNISSGTVTLMGHGVVAMSDATGGGDAFLQGNGEKLVNQDTIRGSGIIGNGSLTVVNSGTIEALAGGKGVLTLNGSGGLTNTGVLEAAGGLLHVTGGPFTNFSGHTLTGGTYNASTTLEIDELGSTGGEIVTNAASIILNGPSASFVDAAGKDAVADLAANTAAGSFSITGGRKFTTVGNFDNLGSLTVGSGSTLVVHGNLLNFSGTTLTGGTYNVSGTLQFNGANVVTNAANITLTGAASKIINQASANGLAMLATNASTGSLTIGGGRVFTTASAFTNSGSLTVTGAGSKFTTGSAHFTNNGSLTISGGDSETATGTGAFSNAGTLTVAGGSTFALGGSLTNFSGTTLTGGTYNVAGTFQFAGANVVTNAAKITLTGAASKIINSTNSANALANFASNASSGSFSLQGARVFTTLGNFSNAGIFTIGTGSTFALGGVGNFTQTAGILTDAGTLSTSGSVTLSGGSLFGTGLIKGALQSSGVITPGASATSVGILTDSGSFKQNTGGSLDISIGGTTAGSKFDQLNSTTASLAGTLNIKLVDGFVPTLGTTLKILDFGSETGKFTTVNGSAINSSEHFAVTYQATDVLLTVVSGAATVDAGVVPGLSLGAQDGAERLALRPALARFEPAFRSIPGLSPGAQGRAERLALRPTLARFEPAFRSALPAMANRVPWRMNRAGFGGRASLHSYGRAGRARGSLQFSLLSPLSMPVLSFASD